MDSRKQVPGGFILLLAAILALQAGCSSGGSSTPPLSEISRITEISANSNDIAAAQGGSVVHEELTAIFPPAVLPGDMKIKLSRVSVSNSTQDPFLTDMTGTYVLSTTSSANVVELADSATLEFRIDPAGFDETSIRLVFWDGYNWEEVPGEYDQVRQVVSVTDDVIMPFGTEIYRNDPGNKHATPRGRHGRETITEFVGLKVVGVLSGGGGMDMPGAAGIDATAAARAKALWFKSANFTVEYTRAEDMELAKNVSAYLENAHENIVVQMGFRKPGKSAQPGFGTTLPTLDISTSVWTATNSQIRASTMTTSICISRLFPKSWANTARQNSGILS
jgi:hypothetical protein